MNNQYLILTDEELSNYYCDNTFVKNQILDNTYAALMSADETPVEIVHKKNGELKSPTCFSLTTAWNNGIKPRNLEQRMAFDMMNDDEVPVKLLTGSFGSGKDFIMINFALKKLEEGKFDRLVWVRNNIDVENTVNLGALPGDADNKLLPFAMPLADHLGGTDALLSFIDNGQIEIQHLGFIRGRDYKRTIVYCSEAENLTKKQVQLLLGRIGEGSQLWLNGDYRQADRRIFREDSGILSLIAALTGNRLFRHINLPKTERSEVASLADELDKI